MRKTIKFMIENLKDLPKDFDGLVKDERVMVAAEALDTFVQNLAIEIMKKQKEAEKAKKK